MTQLRNAAKLGILTLAAMCSGASYAATIVVTTTDMAVDIVGREFIDLDTSTSPAGRSGLYKADSLTIDDLNDISKNPADANSGSEPAISLPEAIIAANNTPGADAIILAAGETYTLNSINNYWYGANALPPITSPITIRGDGLPELTRPSQADKGAIIQRDPNPATPSMRLFFVMSGSYSNPNPGKVSVSSGNLTLENLHIKNGYALGGSGSGGGAGMGGAIFNQGVLTLLNSTFSDNTAQGGDGSSTAGLGGGGVGGNGVSDLGGGFFNTHFIGNENTLTPDNSTISIFGGNGGAAGSGGFGPTNDNGINGGGPADSASTHSSHGAFGAGGGRAAANAASENGNGGAFGSGGGYGLTGGPGGFGGGGGQSITPGSDSTAGFAGGKGTVTSGGGGAGLGGAIFNHTGITYIQSSTFSGNSAIGGGGDFGGSAYGAAVFSANAAEITGRSGLTIIHSTIFDNICINGSGTSTDGVCDSPVYILGITGAGVQDGGVNTKATIANSIIASPEAPGCIPPNCPTSLSNNKIGNNSGSTLTLTGKNIIRYEIFQAPQGAPINQNINNTIDAAPFSNAEVLADNGGLTPTILPVSGPAIDAVDNSFALESLQSGIYFDQRRRSRYRDSLGTGNLDSLIADVGSVQTGANTAPEITLVACQDENEVPITCEYRDSSSTPLNQLLSVSDADDLFQNSSLDAQLDIALSGGHGSLNIAINTLTSTRDSGLTFISPNDGVNETNMTIIAPLYVINLLLGQITFDTSALAGSGSNDTATFSLTLDDLDDFDGPSTNLTDTEILPINIQGTPPTASIGSISSINGSIVFVPILPSAVSNGAAFTIDVYFDEAVQGFDSSDITITNGTVIPSSMNILIADQAFRVSILPDGQGDIQMQVPAGAALDPILLPNTASNTVTVVYDIDKPSISTTGIPSTISGAEFTARFIFSENVSGFTRSDIRINNATLSDFTAIDASTYSVVITPNQAGAVRYSINPNIASDAAGNGNLALAEQVIPLQDSSSSGGGGSYNPLISLLMLMMYWVRRRT